MKSFERNYLQQIQDSDKTKDNLKMAIFQKRQKRNIFLKKSNEQIENDEKLKRLHLSLDISGRLNLRMEILNTHI